MKQKLNLWLMLLGVIVVMVLVGAGCEVNTTKETTNETTNTNASTTSDTWWTSSTSRGSIQDTAIAGTINGEKVTIASVQIDVWDGEYDWSFSTLKADSICGVIVNDNAVNFSSKVLQAGTFKKAIADSIEFDDYHAYYYYQQADGTPMSVNPDWAATMVVSKIDETNNTVTGWASFEFNDGLTKIEGSFTADLCE